MPSLLYSVQALSYYGKFMKANSYNHTEVKIQCWDENVQDQFTVTHVYAGLLQTEAAPHECPGCTHPVQYTHHPQLYMSEVNYFP